MQHAKHRRIATVGGDITLLWKRAKKIKRWGRKGEGEKIKRISGGISQARNGRYLHSKRDAGSKLRENIPDFERSTERTTFRARISRLTGRGFTKGIGPGTFYKRGRLLDMPTARTRRQEGEHQSGPTSPDSTIRAKGDQ